MEIKHLKLGARIVNQLNNLTNDMDYFSLDNTGYDIEEIFLTLSDDVKKILEVENVVSQLEINIVICDITAIRSTKQFKGEQADKSPNRFIGISAIVLVLFCIYKIFVFAIQYTNAHGKIESVVYEYIKVFVEIFKMLVG